MHSNDTVFDATNAEEFKFALRQIFGVDEDSAPDFYNPKQIFLFLLDRNVWHNFSVSYADGTTVMSFANKRLSISYTLASPNHNLFAKFRAYVNHTP
ncbi:MAG: hypothetical protein QXS68_02935 [Candidatus Methanomethylicaceae archaeon]